MRQTDDRRGANTSRGQAGPLSYALVFAMILTGATVVLATGGMALSDAQDTAEAQRAEHTMTLFDSRAAMVALGESNAQSISFGQDSGIFETRPTDGYLAIRHSQWAPGEDPVELYNETLGSVVYENGERELAYQGGGVWRLDAEGEARIISPPEFHYRGATLTLPVVRVDGNASGSGSVTARITGATRAEKVYPDASETYPAPASSRQFLNPIREGEVSVFVRSDYYRGWATYFRQRTQGNVTVFDANQTVKVQLKSIGGAPGEFDMPLEGNSLPVEGFGEDHPISDFSLTLKADNNFNNGHWSLYSTDDGDEFEMHIWMQGKCTGGGAGSYNDDIDFSVYYYNASTGEVREWQNSSIDPTDPNTAFDVSCADEELTVDFTSVETNLTYKDIDLTGSNNKWCFGDHIDDRDVPTSVTLDQHSPVDGGRTYTENTGNNTMRYVVNHYMGRMGVDYDLTVKDGPGNSECLSGGGGGGSSRVDETQSYGTLRYAEATGAQYITYLHVTDNEINVSVDT
jgi:hypothetical protein